MPAPNLTVDEIVAYLSRSQLPTVVVEGKDDMRIYGWAEARVGNTKAYVLATGGRNTLLAVYQRRNEFANLPVAFVADRDLWLFSEIPADYHDVIWTQGYSIENDLYTGAELEDLLDAHEVDEHQQVLYAIIEWFAFEVEEFLAGRVAEVDRSCDEIVPPGETKMDEGFSTRRGFRAPDSELIQQIKGAYQLKLRGKFLFEMLVRFLNARGRGTKYNAYALHEIAAKRSGPHLLIERLIVEIEKRLRDRIQPNSQPTTS